MDKVDSQLADVVTSEVRRKAEKPCLDSKEAKKIAEELFGIKQDPKYEVMELDSYDDRNFLITSSTERFVLKVHNGVDSDTFDHIEAQNFVLQHLNKENIRCPVPIIAISSPAENDVRRYFAKTVLELKYGKSSKEFVVRMLNYLPGKPLSQVQVTEENMTNVGRFLGRMSLALSGIFHQGAARNHQWDLQHTLLIRPYIDYCTVDIKETIIQILEEFSSEVSPVQHKLAKSIIQGDFNDANILIAEDNITVTGVLDFGDMVYTSRVNELAIAMAYAAMRPTSKTQLLSGSFCLFQGFSEYIQLEPMEISILPTLIASRLATSICIGAYSRAQDPSNSEYLSLHAKPAINTLKMLRQFPKEVLRQQFEEAVQLSLARMNHT